MSKGFCCLALRCHHFVNIHIHELPVPDPPVSLHHHGIRTMGSAQHQSSNRISGPAKSQFIQIKQCQVCLQAGCDLADVGSMEQIGASGGGQLQRVVVTEAGRSVIEPLAQERLPDLLHQVGAIVRRRAIDTEAHRTTCINEIVDGTDP